MEDFLGLLFLALFYIVPKMLRKNHKKKPLPTQTPPRLPAEVPLPLPIRKIPSVEDPSFKPYENVEKEREPILKTPVFKKKYRKKKGPLSFKRDLFKERDFYSIRDIKKAFFIRRPFHSSS